MGQNMQPLPDTIDELKKIIGVQRDELTAIKAENEHLTQQHEATESALDELTLQYTKLEEQYRILQKRFFAKRSEKLTKEDELQGRLFNEVERSVDEVSAGTDGAAIAAMLVKEHTRRKAGRKRLPDYMLRKTVVHDLSDAEKQCQCCGKERPCIGVETSEELEIIPMQLYVLEHQKKKYGACTCEGFLHSGEAEVKTAAAPPRMLPGSIASASMLAYAAVSKFVDALPFYRLSRMLERIGMDLSRATLCNWMIRANERMKAFFAVFDEELLKGPILRMDETPLQVICEDGRPPDATSYMWVTLGYPAKGKTLARYRYYPTRAASVAETLLEGFSGYLQTDGYSAYNSVTARTARIIHVGCFAHARRNFHDAYISSNKKSDKARHALAMIQKLYETEKELRGMDLPDEAFVERRRVVVLPYLDALHQWLMEHNDSVPPSMALGKAIHYALNAWPTLVRYLDHAWLTPDNNASERAIRPFVIGRKNWLFSYTPNGAHASAAMYSLVESAKANTLEPFAYLRFLFTKLPLATSKEDLKALLPCYCTASDIVLE